MTEPLHDEYELAVSIPLGKAGVGTIKIYASVLTLSPADREWLMGLLGIVHRAEEIAVMGGGQS